MSALSSVHGFAPFVVVFVLTYAMAHSRRLICSTCRTGFGLADLTPISIQELVLAQDFDILCQSQTADASGAGVCLNRTELGAAYIFALGFQEYYRHHIHKHKKDGDADNEWLRKSFHDGDVLLMTPLSTNALYVWAASSGRVHFFVNLLRD